jgi:hypothetical protein
MPIARRLAVLSRKRWPELESHARFVASAALAASGGRRPSPTLTQHVSEQVLRRLHLRSKTHRRNTSNVRYTARTFICPVSEQAVEATVVASDTVQKSVSVVAVRFERNGLRWIGSELLILTPPG